MEYRQFGGKSSPMATRNTTYFGVLVGLVIVFSLFYLYNSASNDVATLQREVSAQEEHLTKLKNEILDLNVNLEKSRDGEKTCLRERKAVETHNEECSTGRDTLQAQVKDLENSVNEKEETIKLLRQDVATKTNALEVDSAQKNAMSQAGAGQEAIIIKMNETIELLKKDLALKDNIIHALKNNVSVPEVVSINEVPIELPKPTTLRADQSEANNVLAVPVKPDAVDHPLPVEDNAKPAVAAADNEDKLAINAPEPGKIAANDDDNDGGEEKDVGIAPAALENDKENLDGTFVGVREPGMRIKMEEAQAADNRANDAVVAAAKNDDDRENEEQ